jgi:hypothetical protein
MFGKLLLYLQKVGSMTPTMAEGFMIKSFFQCLTSAVFSMFLLFPSSALAVLSSVPEVIEYQAHLMDSEGQNLNGDISVAVWVYDSPTDGPDGDFGSEHLLYAESHERIHVDRGILRVAIGEGKALGRFIGLTLPRERIAQAKDLYIQLYLNGEKIEPRQHAGHQPYAMHAQYAGKADFINGTLSIPATSLPDMDASKTNGALLQERFPAMNASKITGILSSDHLPALTLDKITSGTLANAVIGHVESSSITSGRLSEAVMPAEVTTSDSLYIEAGDVADGGVIPIPPGFFWPEHFVCGIFLGIKYLDMPTEYGGKKMADNIHIYAGYSVGPGGLVNGYQAYCEAGYGHWTTGGMVQGGQPCTASYLIACVK